MERTRVEILSDTAVTLAFFSEVELYNTTPKIGDRLKMQKLCFLLTHEFLKNSWKGLNYTFFRYKHGPFTTDLYQTETDLMESDLLQDKSRIYSLTPTGRRLGQVILHHLLSVGENTEFGKVVIAIAQEYGRLPSATLKDMVYGMKIKPPGWQSEEHIRDIPLYTDLTQMLNEAESKRILKVDNSWIESFAAVIEDVTPDREALRHIVDSSQVQKDLKKGLQALKDGQMVDWKEIEKELAQ